MQKLSLFSKLWLKYTDRPGYKKYKWLLANHKRLEFQRFISDNHPFSNLKKIQSIADASGRLSINHSGNAGDIIYALPTLQEVHQLRGVTIDLYLKLNQPHDLAPGLIHPLGNVMLNQKMADMLIPLIGQQPYINSCSLNTGQSIDIDLDMIRTSGVPQTNGNIGHWCAYVTGVNPKLWQPWLKVEPDQKFSQTIILARSDRYRNTLIDYTFLNNYPDVAFVGVKNEYEEMRQKLPDLKWHGVKDFLEMARMIAGCKLFIGNQSFPFSLAEGLKVPRILEVSFDVINVVPEGEGGHDFFFQDHFETLVQRLASK